MDKPTTALTTVSAEMVVDGEWAARKLVLYKRASGITSITTDEQFQTAVQAQTAIGRHVKKLSEARLEVTRPIEAAKKKIIAQEKAEVKELVSEQDRLKKLTSHWAAAAKRKEEEERRRLEAEQRKAAEEAENERAKKAEALKAWGLENVPVAEDVVAKPIPLPATPVRANAGRIVTRWVPALVDISKVPRAFLQVDERKVREYAAQCKRHNVTPAIAGFEFKETTQVQG